MQRYAKSACAFLVGTWTRPPRPIATSKPPSSVTAMTVTARSLARECVATSVGRGGRLTTLGIRHSFGTTSHRRRHVNVCGLDRRRRQGQGEGHGLRVLAEDEDVPRAD